LNVVTLHLPGLRDRKSDVPALVHFFLDKFAPGKMITLSAAAMQCMLEYDWPGNVRELENCIERAVALGSEDSIEIHDLPPALRSEQADGAPLVPARVAASIQKDDFSQMQAAKPPVSATDLEELERATIERVFLQVNGDKSRARKMLGISRATLYRKLKRYNIGTEKGASAAS
jgi:DNA-binding NtrC family response regulator